MRRVVTLLFALMASLLVATGSAGAADPALKERVLATVNGKPLTAEMLAFYTQRRLADGSAKGDDAGRAPNLINDLVALEIMAQQAEKQGLQNDGDLQLMIDLTRKNLLAQNLMQGYLRDNPVTDTELHEAYELIKSRLYGTQYHVFHIQVAEEARARELIAQLKSGARFDELARTHSQVPTGRSGGDLDWFGKDQLPAEFSSAIGSARSGAVVEEPVKSSHGWHVIQLAATREQTPPGFAESRDSLEGLVRNQRLQTFVAKLRSQAKIEQPQ